jgi:peptidyl-tRNA hydrolase, PTH1 family
MKYLIVGLGNSGEKYEETRHNIGFKAVDLFVRQQKEKFSNDQLAELAEVKFKGRTIVVIKPTTFMNLSGKAVNYWMQTKKIPIENLLIIHDDIALPFGTLRMKGKGSDGGHNGLKDIQAVLKTVEYPRLRFGIGSDFYPGQQANYVLGEWDKAEKIVLQERLEVCAEFIKSFVSIGIGLTMTNWNNK